MKKFLLAFGMAAAMSFSGGSASAFTGTSNLLEALSGQSNLQQVQYCRRGAYWCPGRISGCCPVGWACGSTTCYRSKSRTKAASRMNKIPGS